MNNMLLAARLKNHFHFFSGTLQLLISILGFLLGLVTIRYASAELAEIGIRKGDGSRDKELLLLLLGKDF